MSTTWKLSDVDTFLFYACDDELVLYNQVARTTSHLDRNLTILFNFFTEKPHHEFAKSVIIALFDATQNLLVEHDVADKLLSHLEHLALIEKVS